MRARRDAALRLLKTMLVASVFIPAAFFIMPAGSITILPLPAPMSSFRYR